MKKPHRTAILPDMPAFVREVTAYGNVGAMARRVITLGLINILRLAWWNKMSFFAIAKKDFAAAMIVLMHTGLLKLERKKAGEYIAIADQVVDLSVAMKNTKMITGLVRAVKTAGYKPILMTNNLPSLIRFLSYTRVRDVWFSFPRNPYGYEMNPSKDEVERYAIMLELHRIYPHESLT